jgi:hypothetical protein
MAPFGPLYSRYGTPRPTASHRYKHRDTDLNCLPFLMAINSTIFLLKVTGVCRVRLARNKAAKKAMLYPALSAKGLFKHSASA